jgi:hypothetical protein
MTSIDQWKETAYYKGIEKKTTQLELYIQKKSPVEILQLVSMANKVFGAEMEGIYQEIFQLSPRVNSQHDGIRTGKKIEIKSARWHATGDDCNWQHLEPEYDYEFVLFTLVDFDSLKVWIISKKKLMALRDTNIVMKQGQQGWTTTKKKIEPYLTSISTVDDLDRFIASSENRTSPPQTVVEPSHPQ